MPQTLLDRDTAPALADQRDNDWVRELDVMMKRMEAEKEARRGEGFDKVDVREVAGVDQGETEAQVGQEDVAKQDVAAAVDEVEVKEVVQEDVATPEPIEAQVVGENHGEVKGPVEEDVAKQVIEAQAAGEDYGEVTEAEQATGEPHGELAAQGAVEPPTEPAPPIIATVQRAPQVSLIHVPTRSNDLSISSSVPSPLPVPAAISAFFDKVATDPLVDSEVVFAPSVITVSIDGEQMTFGIERDEERSTVEYMVDTVTLRVVKVSEPGLTWSKENEFVEVSFRSGRKGEKR